MCQPIAVASMVSRVGLAYTYLTGLSQTSLAVTASGQPQIWTPLPAGYVLDYSWSPSGHWLAALWQARSDYSGKVTDQKLYHSGNAAFLVQHRHRTQGNS